MRKLESDQRNASETARLRDEGLKRMLKTPPKLHKDAKKGQVQERKPSRQS